MIKQATTPPASVIVKCPYCKGNAKFCASSKHVYNGQDHGALWHCARCDAHVGTHPDGFPLGRLANRELRNAKRTAHEVLDPLWQDWKLAYPDATVQTGAIKHTMRIRAYDWLAHQLGIATVNCHIGHFDLETTIQVMKIIDQQKPTSATIREWAKARKAA